ncbi:MAG: MMPL family transporter [Alphaproteobacteria bacterium]|nr:MMPL family transporter [Alphaproteobacteria bacterium]
MDVIRYSINRPIAVVAVVILVMLFGGLALTTIPIQLSPSIAQPTIHLRTSWHGAAPEEIEREIINRQEEALRGLPGLKSILSHSTPSQGRIRLRFPVGHNMDKALLLVANRLDRVNGYPEEAEAPRYRSADPRGNRIAWIYMWPQEGNNRLIDDYGDFAHDVVRERLERVAGVESVSVRGGRGRELHITFDPAKMARYGLTVRTVLDRLRAAHVAATTGNIAEGKRRYIVRTDWRLSTPENVRQIVLRSARDNATGRVARVTVDDIADVDFQHHRHFSLARMNGRPIINFGVRSEVGVNVIETMQGVKQALAELKSGPIPENGLVLEQMYDETVYIESAIDLVLQNIWVGGGVAVFILLLFLRSGRATLIVALAIPTSVVASFVAMAAFGQTINVVSLAGIAFAVGMVVDAAIIVLENIYRLRQQGYPAAQAAFLGTRQVWGAILVSSLTTILVFVPILFTDLDIGQIFRDIAVAITVAVTLSLFVSVTVIPALANRLLGGTGELATVRLPGMDDFAEGFVTTTVRLIGFVVRSRARALGLLAVITSGAGIIIWSLLPPLEYLPEGDRNLVIGIAKPPPGYNLDTAAQLSLAFEQKLLPYLESRATDTPLANNPLTTKYFTFITSPERILTVSRGSQTVQAKELIALILDATRNYPGVSATAYRPAIFRVDGGTRTIRLTVTGPELEPIFAVVHRALDRVGEILPRKEGAQVRAAPRLELGAPEVRVQPDPVRLADNGVSARDLGLTVDAFNDGIRVDEVLVDGRFMDLILTGRKPAGGETQNIANLPVITDSGATVPVSSLAEVKLIAGPTQIMHEEGARATALRIRPPPHMPLETALNLLRTNVVAELEAEGLPDGIRLRLGGTADALSATAAELRLDLVLAFAIVFLVMAVLFESFFYPLIIVLSVPIAAAGGVIGLTVLNQFHLQQLDMLTLLGFVILIGIVVNNAILLVHQTLHHIRVDGMAHADAVVEATRNRIRPIFMSTLTSVGGMLPLVLFPGAGSELYRGLGSVVVGGLALSAVLTLAIVPPLLALFVGTLEGTSPRSRST